MDLSTSLQNLQIQWVFYLQSGLVLFGLSIWAMWREKTANALNAKVHHEQFLNGWLFLSPNLLGFLIFFAGPLLLSFYFSFTDSDAFNPPNWVGFENYAKILNIRICNTFFTRPAREGSGRHQNLR